MFNMTKEDLQRHLISFGLSFLSAFLVVLGNNVAALDFNTITVSAVVGIIFAAARAALKIVLEKATKRI